VDNLRAMLEKLLETYLVEGNTTPEGAMRDVLTDLMHISQNEELDFDTILSGAEQVYQEEVELDENAGV